MMISTGFSSFTFTFSLISLVKGKYWYPGLSNMDCFDRGPLYLMTVKLFSDGFGNCFSDPNIVM